MLPGIHVIGLELDCANEVSRAFDMAVMVAMIRTILLLRRSIFTIDMS